MQKDLAIEEFKKQNYERSLRLFGVALLLHPEDDSYANFKRSVESHRAAVYFSMKQYELALQLGEEFYRLNPYTSKVST